MKRRNLLALVGVATTAGCSTLPSAFGAPRYAELGVMTIENHHTEPHTIRVQVESDGTIVTDRTYELDAYREGGGPDARDVECGWADSTGPFVVRARHESSTDWASLVFEDEYDAPELIELMIRIGGYGPDDDEIRYLRWLQPDEDCPAV